MKLQITTTVLAVLTLSATLPSLWMAPTMAAICCGDPADCPGSAPQCCVYDDELSCIADRPGFCQTVCIPPTR